MYEMMSLLKNLDLNMINLSCIVNIFVYFLKKIIFLVNFSKEIVAFLLCKTLNHLLSLQN